MSEFKRTQTNRPLLISTPLGDDKLMLLSAKGTEALGRLFQFELELMAEAPVDYTKILGQNVTIRLDRHGGQARYFNGYISRFVFVSVAENNKDHKRLYYYRASMVPWTWFLSRAADCKMFQNMTIPDIIQSIFRDRGMTDFKVNLHGTYNPWEYCVQYRETDFNFISRLMENEGIYYYFEHENGKHTMVLCDSPTAHKAAPDYTDLNFDQPDTKSTHDAFLWNWTLGQEITTNQYALTDFDPLQPKTDLAKVVNVEHTHDPGTYEVFDYPGGYVKPDDGRRYVNVRLEEIESEYAIGRGTTSARGIFTGSTFTLQGHPAYDPVEYLITAMTYQLENDDIGGGTGRASGGSIFRAQITCIPSSYEFRSQRITPKPVVQGPQTAIVVGPTGEEIYTDKYGRVKVHFHWDRDSKGDEKSSCWIRVAQNWAGKKWGFMFIPRISHEVIVDFLEGDPDRPIITGRVYNGENMPPYDLPTEATKSTIKSYSSKGGSGFNEIRFEDKKGSEQVFIHSQRQLDICVVANTYETNGGNREEITGHDDKGDRNVLIHNDNNFHLMGDQYVLIDKGRMQQITNDVLEGYCANLYVMVKSAYEVNAQSYLMETKDTIDMKTGTFCMWGTQEVDIKGANTFLEGTNALELYGKGPIGIKAVGDISIKGNNVNIEAQSGITLKAMKVIIDASAQASVKVGGNFVDVGPSGVSINGTMVLINSGGAAGSGSPASDANPAAEASSASDHDITAPIDAAGADCGATGHHGSGSWKPRTHGTSHWGAQHAPPPPPPPPPPKPPGPVPVPPEQESKKPCGIAKLTVSCAHSGRTMGPSNLLEIVATTSSSESIEKKIWKATFNASHKSGGSDSIKIECQRVQGDASGRLQSAVMKTPAAPSESDWKDNSAPRTVTIDAPSSGLLWTYVFGPEMYYVYGRGCDEVFLSCTVENYPSDQYSGSVTFEFAEDIVKRMNKWLADNAQVKWGGDGTLGVEVQKPTAKLSLDFGWKEEKDWRAYFAVTGTGTGTLFGIKVSAKYNLRDAAIRLGLEACEVPPQVVDIVFKIKDYLAEQNDGKDYLDYLAQMFIELSLTGTPTLSGSITHKHYAHDGGTANEGSLAVSNPITLTLKIVLQVGSEQLWAYVKAEGSASTGITPKLDFSIQPDGIWGTPTVKFEGITLKVTATAMAFKIKTDKSAEWHPMDARQVYPADGDDVKWHLIGN